MARKATASRQERMPEGVRLVPGGSITSTPGFVAGAVYAGIKEPGPDKLDLAILASEGPATCAALFTKSAVKGYGVLVSDLHARSGISRAVIVNSGCANVASGPEGLHDANELTELAAALLEINPLDVLVGSTGVIGRRLPMQKIREAVPGIELSRDGGHDFARAIMTTDTHPKSLAVRFRTAGRQYTMAAAAKGSGMIHPDMATMFCFITTDARIERRFLMDALRDAVNDSLNMISVDGDTSTSDTVAIFANGAAGGDEIGRTHRAADAFRSALGYVCIRMAKMLARDGEGAERLIEVQVEGSRSVFDARRAARTISSSPLVKTAVHGCDPNWGRILAAAGRSGARVRQDAARVWIGKTLVYDRGPRAFDERAVSEYLRGEEVLLRIDLGAGGDDVAVAWGCDMSPEYVHINSDYTT